MALELTTQWDPTKPTDTLVLAVSNEWANSKLWKSVDQLTQGWLEKLFAAEEVSTKPNKVTSMLLPPGLLCKQLILVGIGDHSKCDAGGWYRAGGTGAKAAATKGRESVTFLGFGVDEATEQAALIGALNGFQGQDILRKEKVLLPPKVLRWIGSETSELSKSPLIAECMIEMRRLVNLPPNILDPIAMTREATELCKDLPIEIEVWDEQRLRAERCGSLLAVAEGSFKAPRLMIFRYRGNGQGDPVALVGKGVTFDSGGLSIKPTDSMMTMKADMAGAATVLAVVMGAAKLKIDQPLIGIIGLVENMISGNCMKLGDVIRSRSGKTIEMHNTDAEGRMVLADLLNVALEHKPKCIVDYATLTGACVVALGTEITGMMGNDESLESEFRKSAGRVGEWVWPLPMHSHFSEQLVGKIGDLKNMGDGRWGGATIAAKFLEEFVEGTPWLHLDIAGPAYLESAKPWQDIGATGAMVRTTLDWLS